MCDIFGVTSSVRKYFAGAFSSDVVMVRTSKTCFMIDFLSCWHDIRVDVIEADTGFFRQKNVNLAADSEIFPADTTTTFIC